MAKWVVADVLDNGLNSIKNNVTKVWLLKAYALADSLATMSGNKVAEVTGLVAGDFTLATSGNNRTLTAAAKSGSVASGSATQYDSGTASFGTTTTLTDSSKSWTTNVHAGRAVTITVGTGVGQTAVVSSNTATVLTFAPAFGTAPDATSQYRISDNLHIAYVSATERYWVTDETNNAPVSINDLVNFPQIVYTSAQPQ